MLSIIHSPEVLLLCGHRLLVKNLRVVIQHKAIVATVNEENGFVDQFVNVIAGVENCAQAALHNVVDKIEEPLGQNKHQCTDTHTTVSHSVEYLRNVDRASNRIKPLHDRVTFLAPIRHGSGSDF